MARLNSMCTGAMLGAGAMFFFDPQQGRRRRALVRDQCNRMCHEVSDGLDVALRDLSNRFQGTIAEAVSLTSPDHASDDVLVQRVRSKLGRWVSHPAAIEVDVSNGCVVLRGPILSHEVQCVVHGVEWIRGVKGVDNQLEVHETAGDVSALQGEGKYGESQFDLLQSNWAPGTRLLASMGGGLLMLNCLVSRKASSKLWGALGLGLFARAMSNAPLIGKSKGVGAQFLGGRYTSGASGTSTRSPSVRLQQQGPARQGGERRGETRREGQASETRWPESTDAGQEGGAELTGGGERRQHETTERFPPAV